VHLVQVQLCTGASALTCGLLVERLRLHVPVHAEHGQVVVIVEALQKYEAFGALDQINALGGVNKRALTVYELIRSMIDVRGIDSSTTIRADPVPILIYKSVEGPRAEWWMIEP
jgi:nitrate reductase NapAB chaperone NapD